jgi:hypothetical protein
MRIEVNRESTNQNQGGEHYRAFHVVRFRPGFDQTQLRQDLSRPPFLIANMGPMLDKCVPQLRDS